MNENPQAPEGQPGDSPETNTTSTGSTDSTTPAISQPSAGSPETPVTAPTGAQSPAEQVPAQAPGITPEPTASQAPPAPQGAPAANGAPAAHGAAFGPAATASTQQVYAEAPAPAPKRRSLAVPVIAALAVGAVLGGASGAGIFALASNNDSSRVVATSSAQPNVTVNRTDDATTVTAVAAKASPSVVTIAVTGTNSAGTGSGVVLAADGYVLTNTHVVTLDGATADGQIQVTANDGKIYAAKVVGTDPIVDLAVIKLTDASGLTPISFGDSDNLNVGDSAIAIGAPLGLSGTVTDGIVSSLNRSITVASSAVPDNSGDDSSGGGGDSGQSGPYDFWNFDIPGQSQSQTPTASSSISLPVIQTDAAINPGNSGGALLDASGQLIGINVAIASAGQSSSGEQSGSIGVGFAIPSNLAQRVAKEIMADGKATHGLLGATVADAVTADASAGIAGAYLNDVTAGGAAQKAGLQKGDIITEFNGVAVTSQTDLTAQVRYLAAGSDANLVYVRNGQSNKASVTLGSLSL